MIVYRLVRDWRGLYEGSCISEERYRELHFRDRFLFEAITEDMITDMLECINKAYCEDNGLEIILFYSQKELDIFENKLFNNGIID